MAIKPVKNGWQVDFKVAGRGSRRYKRVFPTKGECERFQRYTIAQYETDSGAKPWLEKPQDNRHLSDLAELWHQNHGQYLRDSERTYNKVKATIERLGNPVGSKLTAADFIRYRSTRSQAGDHP